ncbi:MAG: protein-glutamate O-methyltransferase CheR [Gammaproteobacteria bacterium]|nr:MAG: protein-glutamate O-methyltransferase CheR [Gammaproteobacteria bacterium]
MPFNRIEKILYERIGLNISSVGENVVDIALRSRMKAIQCESLSSYADILEQSEDEVNELIETVVIPETWFFREITAYEVLKDYTDRHLLQSGGKLRILSLPCSTGEEPYSIAMTLIDGNIPCDKFHVDAVDISRDSLSIARNADYGHHSFRGVDNSLVKRHFHKHAGHYQLNDNIRKSVSFVQDNILSGDFHTHRDQYDVIFCRNLLIYFDQETKRKAFLNLEKVLKPGGILFLGPAESGSVPEDLFLPVYDIGAFSFIHSNEVEKQIPEATPAQNVARIGIRKLPEIAAEPAAKPFADIRIEKILVNDENDAAVNDDLAKAVALANEGDLEQAESLCKEAMSASGDTSEAFYLLGIIYHARNDINMAESCFRKALYLDPQHYDALINLSIIAGSHGDAAQANSLKIRALRVKNRIDKDTG